MSDPPPTPPADLPDGLVDELASCSADQLRHVAAYAESLADARDDDDLDVEDRDGTAEDSERPPEGPPDDDRPDDVPSKATVTVKEINDNRYYYWQWREGETIKSQYKSPVDPD